jgi:pimeloyl-ACP methyl ester carboxylesterase
LKRRVKKVGEPARPLGGEERRYYWRGMEAGVPGSGPAAAPPVLLVHGVYAGASSYEFRRNLLELAEDFRVYALDLLGCGLSERPRRRYEPEDVASQVEDFAREEIGVQTHLISSSLSAALVVPTAVRSPRLFKKLVLICPTGLGGSLDRPSGRLGEATYNFFRAPILGDALYNAIVSRWGIRYYLGSMAYHDPKLITDELVEYYYRTSHQPGAKYFPAAFVSGKLNLGLKVFGRGCRTRASSRGVRRRARRRSRVRSSFPGRILGPNLRFSGTPPCYLTTSGRRRLTRRRRSFFWVTQRKDRVLGTRPGRYRRQRLAVYARSHEGGQDRQDARR